MTAAAPEERSHNNANTPRIPSMYIFELRFGFKVCPSKKGLIDSEILGLGSLLV